ncbi:hypothetical protein P8918_12565 [Bacillus spizizenii]|nr:hypothetical protein [Bacillus spizizenii]MCY8890403.1 hypothetical protein [Bacillus spizizenii]MEC0841858.1 hypothetical protein [Bacillus spizizenii]
MLIVIITVATYLCLSLVEIVSENDDLTKELEEAKPYVQLSEKQAAYIDELEGQVDALEDSSKKLEKNLLILSDVKEKTK